MDYYELTRKHEGFTPKAFWDHKQWTNGFGTRARSPNEVIDKAEAQRRYDVEREKARAEVRKLGAFSTGREEALTDLTFNAGAGWQNAGLGDAVKRGDWEEAKKRFLQYNRASGQPMAGLARRRADFAVGFDDNGTAAPTQVAAIPNILQSGYGRKSGNVPASNATPSSAFASASPTTQPAKEAAGGALGAFSLASLSKGVGDAIGAFGDARKEQGEQASKALQATMAANASALQDDPSQQMALQMMLKRREGRGAFA
jgi:GH24 family phage-related lysozyme (muramidase)